MYAGWPMYGVDWMTPPHIPATRVASPSIAITPRVSYSSPAAAALSVQSMPPITVPRANGMTIGKYLKVNGHAVIHVN